MRENLQGSESRSFSRGEGVYDFLAGQYDFYNYHFYSHVAEETINHILQLFDFSDKYPRTILDLCCGTGILTCRLARTFPRSKIVGLDLSPEMISIARSQRGSTNIEYVLADAHDLSVLGENIDLITCNYGIHWLEPRVFLSLQQVLNESGKMIFACIRDLFHPSQLHEDSLAGKLLSSIRKVALSYESELKNNIFDQLCTFWGSCLDSGTIKKMLMESNFFYLQEENSSYEESFKNGETLLSSYMSRGVFSDILHPLPEGFFEDLVEEMQKLSPDALRTIHTTLYLCCSRRRGTDSI